MRRPGSFTRSFAAVIKDHLPKRRCIALKRSFEECFRSRRLAYQQAELSIKTWAKKMMKKLKTPKGLWVLTGDKLSISCALDELLDHLRHRTPSKITKCFS
jgi:hypothetical protein